MAIKTLTRWPGGVAAMLLSALLLAMLAAENSLPADGDEKAAALPSDLAKIPTDGMFVVSGRVADVWDSVFLKPVREKIGKEPDVDITEEFQKRFGLPLEQVERMTMFLLSPPHSSGAPLLFVRTVKPYDMAKVVARIQHVNLKKYKDEMLYVGKENWTVYPLDDRSLVYGELKEVNALIDHPQPKTEGNLAAAVRQAAGKHTLVVGMNVKLLKESIGDKLPGEVEPFLPLLQAHSATLSVDISANSRSTAVLAFDSDKDAKAAIKPAEAGLVLLRAGLGHVLANLRKQEEKEAKDIVKLLQSVDEPLKEMRVEQRDATLRTSFEVKIDASQAGLTLLHAVQKVREAAGRTQSANNLKQMALAMMNYADTMQGQLPAHAIYSKDGKPLLSWRVMILPYIEQEALYKQFHLNEPWDSEHNKKLLDKMPRIYASPRDEKTLQDHTTYYQGFYGKSAFFEGKQGLRFPAAFTDGTSNTIMIAEAAKAVPWTKPEDIPFDPAKPLPKLGLPGASSFMAAMCDGSVRTVSHSISKDTLRSAITRDGGEVLGADW